MTTSIGELTIRLEHYFADINRINASIVYEPGAAQHLSTPLAILKSFFESLLGQPENSTMLDLLRKGGCTRFLEAGVGALYREPRQLDVVNQIIRIGDDDRPFFQPADIVVCDPAIAPDLFLQGIYPDQFLASFSRERETVEIVAEGVLAGKVKPFDIIYSRGVVSIGGIIDRYGGRPGLDYYREKALPTVKAMADCLNPANPNAVLFMSTLTDLGFLPFTEFDLTKMGLRVSPPFAEECDGNGSLIRGLRKVHAFDYPNDRFPDVLYRRLICTRTAGG